MGCYYLQGDVLQQDEETGFAWCMKAAEQGYGLALRAVGTCYQFGNGVEENMQEAIKWYKKSLEQDYDPELDQKVQMFEMLEENGGFGSVCDDDMYDDIYDDIEDDVDDDIDDLDYDSIDTDLPAGFSEAMRTVILSRKLGYEGLNDSEDHSIQGCIDFVIEKAKEGNLEAKYTAAKYFIANSDQTELGEQWLREAIEAGYEEE